MPGEPEHRAVGCRTGKVLRLLRDTGNRERDILLAGEWDAGQSRIASRVLSVELAWHQLPYGRGLSARVACGLAESGAVLMSDQDTKRRNSWGGCGVLGADTQLH